MQLPEPSEFNQLQPYRPPCSKCGAATRLARIEPTASADHHCRTFERGLRQFRDRFGQIQVGRNQRQGARDSTMSNVPSDTPRSFRRNPVTSSFEVEAVSNAAGVVVDLRDDDPAFELPARLFEQLPFAIYVCDRDGLLVRYNCRAAELWGRSPLRMQGSETDSCSNPADERRTQSEVLSSCC
jgi:hypothetical protein